MGLGTGFGTAAELYVPLSRKVGLSLGQLSDPDLDTNLTTQELPGNAKLAAMCNQYTVWNARRAVFHHPADRPLEGLDILGERRPEIDISNVDELIRSIASQQGRASSLPETKLSAPS